LLLITVTGGDGAWIGDSAFDGSEPQARFDAGSQLVEVDFDGDGSANFEISVQGITNADQLTATDFLFM